MKKLISILFCVLLLFATTSTTFADVKHFEDGHKTKEYDDPGISLEIPEKWTGMPLDGAWALFPDKDVIFLLTFVEYEDDDLHDQLSDVFLKTATENSLTGMTGVDQKGKAEFFELSNGNKTASALYEDDENTYVMSSTLCGSQIVILGFQSPHDRYTDEYINDLDSILSSAKEI